METSLAAAAFLRFCVQLRRAPRTLDFYRWGLDHLEAGCPVLPEEHRPLLSVLANDRLNPESRYDLERALRRFFRWASKEYGIPNPMLEVERTRRKKKLPRVLSRSEIGAVWAACRDDRDRALMGLLLDTGLRVGEVADLTPQDVGESSLRVTGKVGDRQVPVSPSVRQAILANAKGDLCWVSRRRPGRPLGRSGIQQAVRKIMRRAGLRGAKLGPHTLRHTFATEYCSLGGNLGALQAIMGHERLTTTMRYVHLALRAVAEDHARSSPFTNLLGGPTLGPPS